ncbi:hypothetical protein [Ferrovibrio sp.]|uniref:hypothetical protein n=1 Tax=Ferrovibrio sp. TaxID=1917215 RepID=UPI002610D4BE|nr:hypothetical protein [Ferrovibrio sp.]
MTQVQISITDTRFDGMGMSEADIREAIAEMIRTDSYPLTDKHIALSVEVKAD